MNKDGKERRRAQDAERRVFSPPVSLEAADREHMRLLDESRDIERSLSAKKGEARARARYAMNRKTARLRLVREWISDERNRLRAGIVSGEPLDPLDPRSLLRRALFLLREWAPARAKIKDDEWAVINAIERYVMKR